MNLASESALKREMWNIQDKPEERARFHGGFWDGFSGGIFGRFCGGFGGGFLAHFSADFPADLLGGLSGVLFAWNRRRIFLKALPNP